MKKRISAVFSLLLALCICSCSVSSPKQGAVDVGKNYAQKTVETIRSAVKNQITGAEDADYNVTTVSEDESSSRVANEKFELNVIGNIKGVNVYDPSESDIYGQFVSPSGSLYTMPAFWHKGYERKFEEYDLNAEYDMTSKGRYFAQGNAKINGVLEEKDGNLAPVAKISFSLTNPAQSGSGGAVIGKSGIGLDNDTVSIWLKAGKNLKTDGLFLYFYGKDDQAYAKLPQLSDEWTKYTFYYGAETEKVVKKDKKGNPVLDKNGEEQEIDCLANADKTDFVHANVYNPLPLTSIYSVRIQPNNSVAAGSAGAERYTATGDLFVSAAEFFWSDMPIKTAVLSDFIAEPLKKYVSGDLFGKETITATGNDNYKIRFRFTESGEWLYRVVGKKNGKEKFSYVSSVTVSENPDASKNKGVITVEQTKKRNFVFEDGTPYMPIGMNVCYSQDVALGSTLYDVYFPKMKAAGMNFARAWLTDIDAAYGAQNATGGILNFDARQDKSYQFDRVVSLAEENGLYLQIPMQAISAFRKDNADATLSHRWDTNPYNKLNGGYLDEPWEYFTDRRAIEDTKKLYRYYVARYGYSRNILNWELMNEIGMDSTWYGVEITQEQARDWADEIGDYMHSVDPYRHLVSISSGNDHSDAVYSAKSVDFVSFHWYYSKGNYAVALANECYSVWKRFGKPALIGETGASGTSEAYNHDKDPYGMLNKQTAFTCGMGGGAAGAMTFWEECVNKYNQYSNYSNAAEMFKLFGNDYVTLDTLTSENYVIDGQNASRVWVAGYFGKESVYAYLTDTSYNYSNLIPGNLGDMQVTFKGGYGGKYGVTVFDTQNGVILKTFSCQAENGNLTIALDGWSCDVALIINRTGE